MQKHISSSSSQNSEDEEILTPTEKSPNKLSIPIEKERRKSKFIEQPKKYQRIEINKKSYLKKKSSQSDTKDGNNKESTVFNSQKSSEKNKNPDYLPHSNNKTLINSKKERFIDYPENIKSKSFINIQEYPEQGNPRNNSQYIPNDQNLAVENEENMPNAPNTENNMIIENNHEFIQLIKERSESKNTNEIYYDKIKLMGLNEALKPNENFKREMFKFNFENKLKSKKYEINFLDQIKKHKSAQKDDKKSGKEIKILLSEYLRNHKINPEEYEQKIITEEENYIILKELILKIKNTSKYKIYFDNKVKENLIYI